MLLVYSSVISSASYDGGVVDTLHVWYGSSMYLVYSVGIYLKDAPLFISTHTTMQWKHTALAATTEQSALC
jgi:uncharacterized protein (DUF779 family)